MNDYQRWRFADNLVHTLFNTVYDKKIAIFGFAFKKNTSDNRFRESSGIYICKYLVDEGAQINVYDPKVPEDTIISDLQHPDIIEKRSWVSVPQLARMLSERHLSYYVCTYVTVDQRFSVFQSAAAAAESCRAIAILTEWDEFKELNYEEIYQKMMKPAFIFDGHFMLDHEVLMKIGYQVHYVGKKLTPCPVNKCAGVVSGK